MPHFKTLALLRLSAILATVAGSIAACDGEVLPQSFPDFETQLTAPSPDYEDIIANAPMLEPHDGIRERIEPPPPNAKEVGEVWIARLEARGALMGHGLSGKGPDGTVDSIDTLLTAEEFDEWVSANEWTVPRHIRWYFQPPAGWPRVASSAEGALRYWPSSQTRTGWQLQAAEGGRIFVRDGCVFVERHDGSENLAWFHAETGLDRDEEDYLVLINRTSGQIVARLGEKMTWAAPNHVDETSEEVRAYRAACGDYPVHGVGNPQSDERMFVQYPHLRNPAPNPPPPSASAD